MNRKLSRTVSLTGIVASLLITASPALAHGERDYRHGPRHVRQYRPPVVVVRPMIRHRYAPAPVYYVVQPRYVPAPAYYRSQPVYVPAPTYYGRPSAAYAPLGAIGGAVVGAAIGSGLDRGNGRTAAIAIGSVVGAMIGGQLTDWR